MSLNLPPLRRRPVVATGPTVEVDTRSFTAAELRSVRSSLESQLEKLRLELEQDEADLADLVRDSGEGAGDDQADAGTKTFEREHEMSLANNRREMVEEVERALARIDAGTYSTCDMCGGPIGKARLESFPRATLCRACKEREERR